MRRGIAAVLLAAACGGAPDPPEPPPPLPRGLERAVHEYFHLRKRALVAGDPAPLLARYPRLADTTARRQGVNAEVWLARSRGAAPGPRYIDADVDARAAGPMEFLLRGDSARVRVRGREMFLLEDYTPSGGEFDLTLHLVRRGDGWEVVRTDEVTLAELHHPRSRDSAR
jgi:hypothetical protein